MDINELESYRLSDAVKFHQRLNPRIWGRDEHLLPEVRQALLAMAEDFKEFLGVNDLAVKDITVSGSNAAFSYTPHSDIDLHLVVDMPQDSVYRELFDAKKYQYNDEHDLHIGPYEVELYVQDAATPIVSQGVYSVVNGEWLSVPRRKRAKIDDASVQHKYEDLGARIEQAIAAGDLDHLNRIIDKVKNMRKTGLADNGEFGAENLAYKLLRAQGLIDRLYAARTAAKDQLLSITERKKRKKSRTRYAYGGWWYPGFGYGSGQSDGEGGGDGGGGESLREDTPYWQWIPLPMPEFDAPIYVKFADDRVLIGTENMEIDGEAPGRFYLSFSADLGTGHVHDIKGDWNRNEPFDIDMVDRGVLQDIVEEVLTAVGRRWGATADAIRAELEGGIEIDEDREKYNYLWYFNRERWGGLYSRGQEDARAKLPPDPAYGGMGGGSGGPGYKIRLQGSAHMDPDLRKAMVDEYMAGYRSVQDEEGGGISIDTDESVQEDRASDERRGILVRQSDAIDAMINRLDHAKIYQASRQRDQAQGALSEVMSKFTDTFQGKISREKYEDFIVPLDWSMDALADETWDTNVVNQTIDISLNLLDEMNDQIWREITQAKDPDEEGGIEVDLTEASLSTPDGVGASTRMYLSESDIESTVKKFIRDTIKRLGIERRPKIFLHRSAAWSKRHHSFGMYDPETHELHVSLPGRHLLDILRTTAHELTHCRQHERSPLPDNAGETGSPYENEAHATAGKIMRDFADDNPQMFAQGLREGIGDYIPPGTQRAIAGLCLAAGLSGCVTMDQLRSVQTLGRAVQSMERYGTAGAQEELTQEIKNYLRAKRGDPNAQNLSHIYRAEQQQRQQQAQPPGQSRPLPPNYQRLPAEPPTDEDYDPNARPPGPEFKPTMPAGTTRIDVSDMYDWYKLGQHISNLKGLGHHDFGKGPPSTIIAFGSEDEEHKYIKDLEKTGLTTTDIDPRDPHPPRGMKPQKTDPTFNVNEATGYVPVNDREARDPRYSMAITQDIRPGEIQRQARKMGFRTTAAGIPPLLVTGLKNALREFKETGALNERCWTGYRHRQVPNCVPVSETQTDIGETAIGVPPVGPVLPMPSRLPRRQPPWPAPDEQRKKKVRAQNLDEVAMSPGALRQWAGSDAGQNVLAGFEAELIVPNVSLRTVAGGQPDYSDDPRPKSIDEIMQFFRRVWSSEEQKDRTQERLWEEYESWVTGQINADWVAERDEIVRQYMYINMWEDDDQREKMVWQALGDMQLADPKNPTPQEGELAIKQAGVNFQNQIAQELERPGRITQMARDEFFERMALDSDYTERQWLRTDSGYQFMHNVQEEFSLAWPYETPEDDREPLPEFALDLMRDIGDTMVAYGTSYHGPYVKWMGDTWQKIGNNKPTDCCTIEPDTSIEGYDSADDAGLEIVSPPEPLAQSQDRLAKVLSFARRRGARTHETTGLHMNISMPGVGSDIDYVKLILFMGDEYVLQQFGRQGGAHALRYAASAMDKMRKQFTGYDRELPEAETFKAQTPDSTAAAKLMRQGLLSSARNFVQGGVGSDKYVSVHVKPGYIEFRSPGGEYLSGTDKGIAKLEQTMNRFARAYALAADPQAEREEYAKKLYKLLTGFVGVKQPPVPDPQSGRYRYQPNWTINRDNLRLFALWSAHLISDDELKNEWSSKVLLSPAAGQQPESQPRKVKMAQQLAGRVQDWYVWVPKLNNSTIVRARTQQDAFERARLQRPEWANVLVWDMRGARATRDQVETYRRQQADNQQDRREISQNLSNVARNQVMNWRVLWVDGDRTAFDLDQTTTDMVQKQIQRYAQQHDVDADALYAIPR